jgi:hypothetical protein
LERQSEASTPLAELTRLEQEANGSMATFGAFLVSSDPAFSKLSLDCDNPIEGHLPWRESGEGCIMSALTHEYRAGSAADKELQFSRGQQIARNWQLRMAGEAAYLTLAKSWYTQIQPQIFFISGMSRDTADLQLSPSDWVQPEMLRLGVSEVGLTFIYKVRLSFAWIDITKSLSPAASLFTKDMRGKPGSKQHTQVLSSWARKIKRSIASGEETHNFEFSFLEESFAHIRLSTKVTAKSLATGRGGRQA